MEGVKIYYFVRKTGVFFDYYLSRKIYYFESAVFDSRSNKDLDLVQMLRTIILVLVPSAIL